MKACTLALVLLLTCGDAARDRVRGQRTRVGRVTGLRLMNADTNVPLPGFDPMTPNTVIDVSLLPTSNLNIEALTEGAVESLRWTYSGMNRTEQTARWSFCGNNRTDFFTCRRLTAGFNATIQATPYAGARATGTAGSSKSIAVAIVQTRQPRVGPVTLTLMNADSDTEIGPLRNGTVIDLLQTPRINVRANVDASVQSVQFALDGRVVRVENGAPFAMYGNQGNNYNAANKPLSGRHVITAWTYGSFNAQDAVSSRTTVSVTFRSAPSPAPQTAPTRAPKARPKTSAPVRKTPAPVRPQQPDPVRPTAVAPTPTVVTAMPIPFGNDKVPPKLLKLVVLNPVVDVTNGPASAVVQITAQDDSSGIGRCLVSADGNNSLSTAQDEYSPMVNTGNRIRTFNLTLTFQPLMRQGRYQLTVLLNDNNFNFLDLYYPTLVEQGYPSSIQVVSPNQDVTPPQMVRMVATTPTIVDVSRTAATVTIQVELEDFGYGVSSCSLFATGGRNIEAYQGASPPVVGRTTLTLSLVIPAAASAGNYTLRLSISDEAWNNQVFESSALAQLGYPSVIQVLNTSPDTTPPQLKSFSRNGRTTVEPVTSYTAVPFTLTVYDAQSGFFYGAITATYNGNQTLTAAPRWLPGGIKEVFPLSLSFLLDTTSWKGVYTLSVSLADDEGNKVFFSTKDLVARGFPSNFTVV